MALINEEHNWSTRGKKITSNENKKIAQDELEQGPIIVEHWFYCGASAPARLCFDDFESYEEYISSNLSPGDDVWIWSFSDLCKNSTAIAQGKYPDDKGRVPENGAY